MPPPIQQRKTIAQVLYIWICIEKLVTADDLAEIADCTPGTMYAYAEGKRDVPFRRARRLNDYMRHAHGRNDIAECLLGYGQKISGVSGEGADDDPDNNIAPCVEALGDARRARRERRRSDYFEALHRAEREIDTLRVEGEVL